MSKWKITKSDLKNNSVFLTLDCGSVLVKCLYVDFEDDAHNTDGDNDNIIFTSQTSDLLKDIGDLLENIKSRKSKLECFQSKSILVSGFQAETFRMKIMKIFDCEVKVIPEMEAIADGLRFLSNDAENNPFIYLPEVIESFSMPINSKIIQKLLDSWKKKMELENINSLNKDYPILYVSAGATIRFIKINYSDQGTEASYHTMGGNSLLGIGKCLLDDNNFQRIIDLASKGKRGNVDTQYKDILENNGDAPYGSHAPEAPVFSFGKAMELNTNETCPYEIQDMTHSLTSMFLENGAFLAIRVALMTFCKKIYIGGNLFQDKVFRIEYSRFCKRLPELVKIHFLKGGIETNIGMLLQNKN